MALLQKQSQGQARKSGTNSQHMRSKITKEAFLFTPQLACTKWLLIYSLGRPSFRSNALELESECLLGRIVHIMPIFLAAFFTFSLMRHTTASITATKISCFLSAVNSSPMPCNCRSLLLRSHPRVINLRDFCEVDC